jgi:carbonic anhydrase
LLYRGKDVPIAPNAVCKTGEGVLIHIGDYSNMEDEIILHAIDAFIDGVNNDYKSSLKMKSN